MASTVVVPTAVVVSASVVSSADVVVSSPSVVVSSSTVVVSVSVVVSFGDAVVLQGKRMHNIDSFFGTSASLLVTEESPLKHLNITWTVCSEPHLFCVN